MIARQVSEGAGRAAFGTADRFAGERKTRYVRVTRDGDHSFRGIVISRFAGRDHLFRAS
jgi:hypothetical protein